MREYPSEKKDALTTKSPYDNFAFQLSCLLTDVFEDTERKYGEHFFLNPQE